MSGERSFIAELRPQALPWKTISTLCRLNPSALADSLFVLVQAKVALLTNSIVFLWASKRAALRRQQPPMHPPANTAWAASIFQPTRGNHGRPICSCGRLSGKASEVKNKRHTGWIGRWVGQWRRRRTVSRSEPAKTPFGRALSTEACEQQTGCKIMHHAQRIALQVDARPNAIFQRRRRFNLLPLSAVFTHLTAIWPRCSWLVARRAAKPPDCPSSNAATLTGRPFEIAMSS